MVNGKTDRDGEGECQHVSLSFKADQKPKVNGVNWSDGVLGPAFVTSLTFTLIWAYTEEWLSPRWLGIFVWCAGTLTSGLHMHKNVTCDISLHCAHKQRDCEMQETIVIAVCTILTVLKNLHLNSVAGVFWLTFDCLFFLLLSLLCV